MSPLEIPVSAIDEPLSVSGKYFRAGEEVCFLKVVTFGPFPAGAYPDEGRSQLPRIREDLGANALRLYEVPSLEFMHDCAAHGLRVFITIPWSQHVDFFKNGEVLPEADQRLWETTRRFRGHPALAGYFVGNEIETTLVRWMGKQRVLEQIERLIDMGHANDPDALFAYANYPSTEYLIPTNQDFAAFNLYLESPEKLSNYLDRLQNLAGDKPLLISEFGVDTISHSEEAQEEMLSWHVEEACRAGVVGTTIFSWSDHWRRGGETIEDWSFGLVRRDGSYKPALPAVEKIWSEVKRPSDLVRLRDTPKVSVIVCTYRGSGTLVSCLDSLERLAYPNFEVLLVNDGSDSRVSEIAGLYDSVKLLEVEHVGLSAARNLGAEVAAGDIFVYTDDDCIVETDWLTWIVKGFEEGPEIGCVGGPNIPPAPIDSRQAVIIAAPGGPTHVLLDDTRAEHLPGCNLAVRREAFEKVGGFNPIFRTAGDDVDFCWRVIEAGYELGFVAAAFVWHHRRFTRRAYFRQQKGYGYAEALLMPLHRDRFRGLGGAVWDGQVYSSGGFSSAVVYHGHYGYEPFQLVYPSPEAGMGDVLLHVIWWVLALGIAIWAIWNPWLWLLAAGMVIATIFVAGRRAGRARIDPKFDSTWSRLVLAGLIVAQGFLRSGARILHGWKHAKWTQSLGVLGSLVFRKALSPWWKLGDEMVFWSEDGVGRDQLLGEVRAMYPESRDDESGKTDILLKSGMFWNWAILTVTEYHKEGQLTRVRLLARPQMVTRVVILPLLVLAVGGLAASIQQGPYIMLLGMIVYAVSRLYMRLKRANLFHAAEKAGLTPG